MIWDTTEYFLNYEKNIRKIYINNFIKSRETYFNIIKKISKKKHKNIDWWVSSVGERNNYSSKLFHYLCLINTLEYASKKKINIETIIVDNFYLFKILKKKFLNYKIILKKNNNNYSFIVFLFKHIIIFFLSKMFQKKKNYPKKNIILVDRFISSVDLNQDRYYNNFFDRSDLNTIYFPTIVNLNFSEIFITIQKIQKSNKFLNKIDFLSFNDFIFSLKFYFRRKKLFINNFFYKKYDISKLINSEINSNLNLNASVIGIQNFLFTKKLAKKKIHIKKIINWFENTAVDKGLNFGINKFHKNVGLIGYQGFTSYKEFMCLDPTDYEKKYNLIPHKIVCMGKNLILAKKEIYKDLPVYVGPALRFDHVFNNLKKKRLSNSVLVNLNLDFENSKLIVENLLKTDFYNKHEGKLYLKSHPLLNVNKIINIKNKKNIFLISGNIFDLASQFKVAVSSGATSSILETIVAGCKMCFPFDNFTDSYSLKIIKTPLSSYKVCKDITELSDFLTLNTNTKENQTMNLIAFKKKIFMKKNKKNISLLI